MEIIIGEDMGTEYYGDVQPFPTKDMGTEYYGDSTPFPTKP